MLSRNDQEMGRSLRVDVGECKDAVVLVHRLGWNGAFDDFAENAIHSVTSVHGPFGKGNECAITGAARISIRHRIDPWAPRQPRRFASFIPFARTIART